MKARWLLFAAALVLLVGCESRHSPPEYQSLTIARFGGYGFCASDGMVLTGSLSFADRTLSGDRAVPVDASLQGCLDRYADPCLAPQAFRRVDLTEAQLDLIRARISTIPEKECQRIEGLACDPCLITSIEVDAVFRESNSCCGRLNDDFSSAFEALASSLDALASGVPRDE